MKKSIACIDVARAIVERLSRVHITQGKVTRAKQLLLERRRLRNEPPGRKGHEYVAEIMLRPIITAHAIQLLGLTGASHERIYSSHYHTTTDRERDYSERWKLFKSSNRSVDTLDETKGSHRADLFISMEPGLVSIEFKCLKPLRTIPERQTGAQIRQHLTKHRACILVIYAGAPPSHTLAQSFQSLKESLAHEPGALVAEPIVGPEIDFP